MRDKQKLNTVAVFAGVMAFLVVYFMHQRWKHSVRAQLPSKPLAQSSLKSQVHSASRPSNAPRAARSSAPFIPAKNLPPHSTLKVPAPDDVRKLAERARGGGSMTKEALESQKKIRDGRSAGLANEAVARGLIKQMEACVKSSRGAAQSYCVFAAKQAADRYPSLKAEYQSAILKNADPQVLKSLSELRPAP